MDSSWDFDEEDIDENVAERCVHKSRLENSVISNHGFNPIQSPELTSDPEEIEIKRPEFAKPKHACEDSQHPLRETLQKKPPIDLSRFYRHLEKVQAKNLHLKEEAEKKALRECTFSPKINRKHHERRRSLNEFLNCLSVFEQTKTQKLLEQKTKNLEKTHQKHSFKPKICPRSKALAPSNSSELFQKLHSYEKKRHSPPKYPFKPKINKWSFKENHSRPKKKSEPTPYSIFNQSAEKVLRRKLRKDLKELRKHYTKEINKTQVKEVLQKLGFLSGTQEEIKETNFILNYFETQTVKFKQLYECLKCVISSEPGYISQNSKVLYKNYRNYIHSLRNRSETLSFNFKPKLSRTTQHIAQTVKEKRTKSLGKTYSAVDFWTNEAKELEYKRTKLKSRSNSQQLKNCTFKPSINSPTKFLKSLKKPFAEITVNLSNGKTDLLKLYLGKSVGNQVKSFCEKNNLTSSKKETIMTSIYNNLKENT